MMFLSFVFLSQLFYEMIFLFNNCLVFAGFFEDLFVENCDPFVIFGLSVDNYLPTIVIVGAFFVIAQILHLRQLCIQFSDSIFKIFPILFLGVGEEQNFLLTETLFFLEFHDHIIKLAFKFVNLSLIAVTVRVIGALD